MLGAPGGVVLGRDEDVVVPDKWVQETGPEEGCEELLGVHQDAVPLGHHLLYVNLHLPAQHSVLLSVEVLIFTMVVGIWGHTHNACQLTC